MAKIKKIVRTIRGMLSDETRTFARTPRKFALKDWKSALLEAKSAIKSKRISILSAGIAYFLTFAIFPAIAAGVAILSFAISKSQLTNTAHALESFLPSDIANLISTQLATALENPSSSIAIIIGGILIALFSISGAMQNIISAANAMYEVDETRKAVKLRLISLAFIGIAGVLTIVVVSLLILNESFLLSIGIPIILAKLIIVIRWVVIAGLVAMGLSAFYRYAPNRANPQWQWVTWGSCISTAIWLIGTTLFFVYARYFAHYTESYSVFAGIIVLMVWLNLTAFAVLLGAEINYRLENQTRAKTTHTKVSTK